MAGLNEIDAVVAAAAQYDREKSWLGPMDVIHKPSFDSPKDRPMMAERYVKGQSSDATGEPYSEGFPVSMEEIALKQRYASETMAGACLADSPHQRQLTKQRILSNLQRQLQAKANEVEKLHRAVTILTLHPEFDMFLELNHLLDGIKL